MRLHKCTLMCLWIHFHIKACNYNFYFLMRVRAHASTGLWILAFILLHCIYYEKVPALLNSLKPPQMENRRKPGSQHPVIQKHGPALKHIIEHSFKKKKKILECPSRMGSHHMEANWKQKSSLTIVPGTYHMGSKWKATSDIEGGGILETCVSSKNC